MSRATFDFEIVKFIIYYRRGSEKTRSDTVVYKLPDYFRWVELRMAQIACDLFVCLAKFAFFCPRLGWVAIFGKTNTGSSLFLLFLSSQEPVSAWTFRRREVI